ncbi:hypothetical protein [Desulfovibrio litoralis]|uniref:Uncharacterized protein n=1 Tax=Desulfovibrio litoralis DSM 11393 TaxID=1121455 RepID=A0A1M7TJ30_9BACT|nr:hypothetical protein [Desulfovibrio litoralis]SHN70696.1 hypothetical protein SAMN02745728_02082 [Desulfovibrio litoralis DSM 11393]
MEWINVINGLATVILAISTIVLAFATLGLMSYTIMLYIETRRMRRIQEAPDISVTIEPFIDNNLTILIHNQGKASAKDIKVTATPDIKFKNKFDTGEIEKNINQLSIMNLSFLRIEQFFMADIGHYADIEKSNNKETFNITDPIQFDISYKNEKGTEYNKTICINISEISHELYAYKENSDSYADDLCVYSAALPMKIFTRRKK